jgi:alanyl-tRNA synthetase
LVGGKGGGRADMAQAGGPEAAELEEAIEKAYGVVEEA